MITGAHAVIYSRNPAADRAFLGNILGFASVDGGGGYPIFALPPSEAAVHEAESSGKHELYLTCDAAARPLAELWAKRSFATCSRSERPRLGKAGIQCGPVSDEGWGLLTTLRLPGGGALGLYEPRHPLAHSAAR